MTKISLTSVMIPELYCSDLTTSLKFYIELLGFSILYQRPQERFAMLERQGARIMLEEVSGTNRVWLTASLEKPFGRGVNLQIKTDKIDTLYQRIQESDAKLFMPIEDRWYDVDEGQIGQRQFIVLDPDGYMLRFAEFLK